MEPFLAQITLFASNFAPRGWAYCDGQLLPISQNSALFSLLGTIYGGDGRTTFALPDLRGRTAIGPRNGPGLSDYRLGQRGGVEYVILNSTQIPSHHHIGTVAEHTVNATVNGSVNITQACNNAAGTSSSPAGNYNAAVPNVGKSVVSAYSPTQNDSMASQTGTLSGATASVTIPAQSFTTLNTGGNLSHENRQPWLAINYIIAMQGTFPSRS